MTQSSVSSSSNRFAQSNQEADSRFKKHSSEINDPFPSIPPTLLNSANIEDYVAATGMIYPFDPANGKLKSASYEIDFLGDFVYWEDEENPKPIKIKKGDKITIKKNSISFFSPEAIFRIPDYIALRFNLKITHVHRGLLLGTGPLIDPGFEGRLVIPLHNLTTNNYEFEGGEGLIWVEFTKLSPCNPPQPNTPDAYTKQGVYVSFPEDKKHLKMNHYLHKAAPYDSIRSSIPDSIRNAEKAAKEASNLVRLFTIGGIASFFLVGYSLYDSLKQTTSLVQDSTVYVKDSRQTLEELNNKVEQLKKQVEDLEKRIASPRK